MSELAVWELTVWEDGDDQTLDPEWDSIPRRSARFSGWDVQK